MHWGRHSLAARDMGSEDWLQEVGQGSGLCPGAAEGSERRQAGPSREASGFSHTDVLGRASAKEGILPGAEPSVRSGGGDQKEV